MTIQLAAASDQIWAKLAEVGGNDFAKKIRVLDCFSVILKIVQWCEAFEVCI